MSPTAESIPQPKFVLPQFSTVTAYSHSLSGTVFEVCVNASFAAELWFDGHDPWDWLQREAEVKRYFLPMKRPDIAVSRVPAADNPEGFYGETMRIRCTWPPAKELAL